MGDPIMVRFQSAEHKTVKEAAQNAGLPTSTFVRQAALGAAKPANEPLRMEEWKDAMVRQVRAWQVRRDKEWLRARNVDLDKEIEELRAQIDELCGPRAPQMLRPLVSFYKSKLSTAEKEHARNTAQLEALSREESELMRPTSGNGTAA